MCGIAGWVDWEKNLSHETKILGNMAKSIQHRGPDAQGMWFSERAAIAHNRLKVIDPEAGQQPMVYQAGNQTLVISYNGEIYNFHELRSQLESKGHIFSTHSDTEVLLHCYIEWGTDCIERLNGLFAFALWDNLEQQLFLARDHLGVKPLFYTRYQNGFIFGSEIKALLAHPQVKALVSKEDIGHIFSFLPVHVPGKTVYQNIFEVAPGHWMLIKRDAIKKHCYWKLTSAPHADSLDKTVVTIREFLDDIVKHQIVADVPICTMLSGGLDSSGITALVAKEFSRQGKILNSYSIDFKDHEKHFSPNQM
ncbi:MAG: asparagine synthase (glutamine-hydrolyzing), partial [Myxococcales bacterium]|nr:asparagine synthase (glutamine-hydrolyzing) [Myxococcales bacterium]